MFRRSIVALAVAASALPVAIAPAKTNNRTGTQTSRANLPLERGLPPLHKQMRRGARALAEGQPGAGYPPILQRIAACESGGNPRAIGGGGAYRGLFQFAVGTWRSVGGSGDPTDASAAEQYKRATILLARSGPGQWPVCAA